jgi:hypothetical protein
VKNISGNQERRNRGQGLSELRGKAAREAASKAGAERVSIEKRGSKIEGKATREAPTGVWATEGSNLKIFPAFLLS